MGLGRRKRRQDSPWIATEELPRTGGHVFYERVNRALDEHGFDRFDAFMTVCEISRNETVQCVQANLRNSRDPGFHRSSTITIGS